jgi:hypothetical protein
MLLRMKDRPFVMKPVALQSAATGLLGGARMKVPIVDPEVIITFAGQKFDDKL